jgi:hypothetical protein
MLSPEDRIIDADPTKDFFISMLVKDIGTTRAIIDLVDNCVDGARRLRPNGKYDGLKITIETTKQHFKISDNCGGIPVDLAKHYAFRFGRPANMEATPYSVGLFGVGMKRAFFKLGKNFRIESTTQTSKFVVAEDVEKWKLRDEWNFEFVELEQNRKRVPLSETGTVIVVGSLHGSIAESFSLDAFKTRLATELAVAHIDPTTKGLDIVFNGVPLKQQSLLLFESRSLKSAHRRFVFHQGSERVKVRLYAGIAESDPSAAGWYVFCNGRLVLAADQDIVTGWGETREVPKYHNQYARFRGYAFFDSRNAALLPWNTTKTGVDTDSPRYRATRLKMIGLTRPVISFLNRLDAEKGRGLTDDKPLEAAVELAKPIELEDIPARSLFRAPKPGAPRVFPQMGRIQYFKPEEKIRLVRKALKVSTLKDVGERTFDYFYKRECES